MTIKKVGICFKNYLNKRKVKILLFFKTKFVSSGELAAVYPKDPNESVWIRDESSDCRKETSDSGEHSQP